MRSLFVLIYYDPFAGYFFVSGLTILASKPSFSTAFSSLSSLFFSALYLIVTVFFVKSTVMSLTPFSKAISRSIFFLQLSQVIDAQMVTSFSPVGFCAFRLFPIPVKIKKRTGSAKSKMCFAFIIVSTCLC